MTADDVVEVMARAYHDTQRGEQSASWDELVSAHADSPETLGYRYLEMTRNKTRAAIRALHERGGLVVGKMPGEAIDWRFHNMWLSGHNAALAAVRANAVEVEGV